MYTMTLPDAGKSFDVRSLTRAEARAFTQWQDQERAAQRQYVEQGGDYEPQDQVDELLRRAYPQRFEAGEFEAMGNHDVLAVYQVTLAYTYGSPEPEKNLLRSGNTAPTQTA